LLQLSATGAIAWEFGFDNYAAECLSWWLRDCGCFNFYQIRPCWQTTHGACQWILIAVATAIATSVPISTKSSFFRLWQFDRSPPLIPSNKIVIENDINWFLIRRHSITLSEINDSVLNCFVFYTLKSTFKTQTSRCLPPVVPFHFAHLSYL